MGRWPRPSLRRKPEPRGEREMRTIACEGIKELVVQVGNPESVDTSYRARGRLCAQRAAPDFIFVARGLVPRSSAAAGLNLQREDGFPLSRE